MLKLDVGTIYRPFGVKKTFFNKMLGQFAALSVVTKPGKPNPDDLIHMLMILKHSRGFQKHILPTFIPVIGLVILTSALVSLL